MKENKSRTPFSQRIALVLLGICLFFLFLESGLRLGGFVISSLQECRNLQSIKQKGTYRILCLGESTTQNQYPPYLERALNQRNIGVLFSVIDKGEVGTNTTTILSKVESCLAEYHPDMVVAMMGINDDEEHLPFEAITNSKAVLFFKSFRVYKLTRLLWLHLQAKAREVWPYKPKADKKLAGFYKSGADKQLSPDVQTCLPESGLKEVPAELVSPEKLFKKAIKLNPKNYRAYVELGWLYINQGKSAQAEDLFKKAIDLEPENDRAYFGLSRSYRANDKFSQAEELYRKTIKLNPKNHRAYIELGWLYLYQGKFSLAEDLFKKLIDLSLTDRAYIELGWVYIKQGKFAQAQDAFRKAIERNPQNDNVYGAMSVLSEAIGKSGLAKEYAQKAARLRLQYYNSTTVCNYRKLKKILDEKGIKLVCVQYPMRSVEPLKKIFEQDKGIIFVDNEAIFKKAAKKANYKKYFKDMFGGDFGHCTLKGNLLLGRNIANVILREGFK
jgi:tetratricopeptide (TPR) repeat protein